jgi:ribosomal-protein-alanine N-acetyltransferase
MSAVARPSERWLLAMRPADLDAVLEIERAVYEFPWTRGNFSDSMHAGYDMQVLMTPHGCAGYFIAMVAADEMHLLNLTVAAAEQGRGHARFMLDALWALAHRHRATQLWLEVRESNERAAALYERYGFRRVGVRQGYYPAAGGTREHAVVMSLPLGAGAGP